MVALATQIDPVLEDESESKERVVALNFSAWQHHLLTDYQSDVTCVTAGYGTGKTFIGAAWTYERMQHNLGCDWIWVEPIYRLINDVAIPAFRELFDLLGMTEGLHYTITKSNDERCIKIWDSKKKRSNKIIFLSAEKPERIVGFSNVAGATIDEAALCTEEVFKNCRSRARSRNAKKPQILLMTTPEGLNWVADLFDSDDQGEIGGWRYLKKNKSIAVKTVKSQDPRSPSTVIHYKRIRATTYANKKNLTPIYIPNLFENYGHNQNYIDSYVFGFFRPFAEGMAYSGYKAALHKILPGKASAFRPIILSWDFNICPQWVAAQQEIDNHAPKSAADRKRIIVLDSAELQEETIRGAVSEFCVKFPVETYGKTRIEIAGDPTGHAGSHKHDEPNMSDFKVIRRLLTLAGFSNVVIIAIKSSPLERISVELVNQEFSNNRLFICSNNKPIFNSIQRTCWKGGKKANLDKPKGDTWTHPMDALKYLLLAILGTPKIFIGGRR